MDERFRSKGLWIGLGVLALLFMCLLVMGAGAAVFAPLRSSVGYVQPPTGDGGAVAQVPYHTHGGPLALLGYGIGLFFKVAFFGLLLMLLLGLVRRIFWGHRAWGHGHWGPPCPPPRPGKGSAEGDEPAAWGPWAWHRHHKHGGWPPWWGEQGQAAGREEEADEAGSEYSGPQE